MRYFDIVDIKEGVDSALVKRLGFAKILILGKDVTIQDKLGQQGRKYIICSKDQGILMKATRDQSVIGISFQDHEIVNKVIAAAKEAEKPIVVNISGIFSKSKGERYRNIGRIRGLLKAVSKAKADPAIISAAPDPDYLTSSLQMVEVAKFLGLKEEGARHAISRIGEYFDS
jgi:RNase P/RNase MRP subunit p30